MDAQKDYILDDYADIVMGSAILHHLAEPQGFISRSMKVLKPGGIAYFFEPMEGGNAIVRLITTLIREEAARRDDDSVGVRWLANIPETLEPQTIHRPADGSEDLAEN